MKISFIHPRGRWIFSQTPEPPLGLGFLSAALLAYKEDLEIEIIDGCLLDEKEYNNKISVLDSDIIGVTTTTPQLSEALKIPSLVQNKRALFIIGGSGVNSVSSSILHKNGYSVISYGDGEETIVELVRALEFNSSLADISGISFLLNKKEITTPVRTPIKNLDSLPFPNRDLLKIENYLRIWEEKRGIRVTQIITSRGCPFSCKFCDKGIFGSSVRYMSPKRVVEEMTVLYEKYKVNNVFFEEDLFTLNKKRVLDLCNIIERELPGKHWSAQARVDTVDYEMLKKMKEAGCTDLMFGVESGSQRLLDYLGKGITVKQVEKAFQWLNRVGISGGMYLIVGIPGENQQDIDKTKNLILRSRPEAINVSFLTPIPGTEIFKTTKHLIKKNMAYKNFNEAFESVYEEKAFEINPSSSLVELIQFFESF